MEQAGGRAGRRVTQLGGRVQARPPIQSTTGVVVSLDTFREGLRSTLESYPVRPVAPLDEEATTRMSADLGAGGVVVQGYRLVGRRGSVDGIGLFDAVGPDGAGVVVKWLPRSRADYSQRISALYTEAQVAQRLVAPGLLPLVHADEDAEGCALVYASGGLGGTLADVQAGLHARGQALPMGLAARLAHGVAETLAFVHGLVARDGSPLGLTVGHLAPEVVGLGPDGAVRLCTWALRVVPDRSFLPGAWLEDAAVPYVAPECLRGDPWTGQAAVYAVGVLLFELLVGRPAYPGVRPEAVAAAALAGGLSQGALLDEGTPEGLVEVVTLATALAPRARYSSPARLAEALGRWLETRDGPRPPGTALAAGRALDAGGDEASLGALGRFLVAHGLLAGAAGASAEPVEDDENTVQGDAAALALLARPAVAAPRPRSAPDWQSRPRPRLDSEGLPRTLRGHVIPAVLLSPEAWTPADAGPTRVAPPPLPPPDPREDSAASSGAERRGAGWGLASRPQDPLAPPVARALLPHEAPVVMEALLPLGTRLQLRARRAWRWLAAWLRDAG
jgi:hypothetical protein